MVHLVSYPFCSDNVLTNDLALNTNGFKTGASSD